MKPEPQVFRRGGNQEPQNEISIAGVITGLKVAKSKRSGEFYAQAALEDTVGKIELIAFPPSYESSQRSSRLMCPYWLQVRCAAKKTPRQAWRSRRSSRSRT